MSRLHVSMTVPDLDQAIRYYSTLFASDPTVTRDDYAKWRLDDPSVNFSVQLGKAEGSDALKHGIAHLGLEADSADELENLYTRVQNSDAAYTEKEATTCCYAASDKSWTTDPAGVAWEMFHTSEILDEFGKPTIGAIVNGNHKEADQPVGGCGIGCC